MPEPASPSYAPLGTARRSYGPCSPALIQSTGLIDSAIVASSILSVPAALRRPRLSLPSSLAVCIMVAARTAKRPAAIAISRETTVSYAAAAAAAKVAGAAVEFWAHADAAASAIHSAADAGGSEADQPP